MVRPTGEISNTVNGLNTTTPDRRTVRPSTNLTDPATNHAQQALNEQRINAVSSPSSAQLSDSQVKLTSAQVTAPGLHGIHHQLQSLKQHLADKLQRSDFVLGSEAHTSLSTIMTIIKESPSEHFYIDDRLMVTDGRDTRHFKLAGFELTKMTETERVKLEIPQVGISTLIFTAEDPLPKKLHQANVALAPLGLQVELKGGETQFVVNTKQLKGLERYVYLQGEGHAIPAKKTKTPMDMAEKGIVDMAIRADSTGALRESIRTINKLSLDVQDTLESITEYTAIVGRHYAQMREDAFDTTAIENAFERLTVGDYAVVNSFLSGQTNIQRGQVISILRS